LDFQENLMILRRALFRKENPNDLSQGSQWEYKGTQKENPFLNADDFGGSRAGILVLNA
jgi:hypothetical protein